MSETEWAELVAEWRASGQTAREFAAAHGVADSALRYWSGRLGPEKRRMRPSRPRAGARAPGATAAPSFARVIRPGEAPPAKTEGRITLVVGKVSIVVEPGFDGAQLREVVRALSEVG